MSMFDAASDFQFEDSKVVIRGFKSHDRWATTKSGRQQCDMEV
jgi:hypothetical protein